MIFPAKKKQEKDFLYIFAYQLYNAPFGLPQAFRSEGDTPSCEKIFNALHSPERMRKYLMFSLLIRLINAACVFSKKLSNASAKYGKGNLSPARLYS
jgi:hypothetical protein